MTTVVAGILTRGELTDRRILLAQRPHGKDYAYAWECPGGKVENDESHHAALKREWLEELNVNVEVANVPVCQREINTPTGEYTIAFYCVEIIYTPPECRIETKEGQGIGWFTESEMRRLTLAPGNVNALAEVTRAAFRA